ncbi:hypothetical protein CYLTODRAFT_451524 [Cylindrobasidium torrendii FP15055 ss-10]|uniref:Uncharacterized protein n=1 Tax=Cylindrobasidium torrendii FP15055 ss-10 TaxID=1314674 RepID=A0A0D7BKH5_9AGAR|nr:hypothetical protein CYLTODRAFT_451524 [Cylindrobasidium torrendii FP15055 ss-10]
MSDAAAERTKYSQDLAKYTMRQFKEARIAIDKHQFAAAKVPASISERIESILQPKSPRSESRASSALAA